MLFLTQMVVGILKKVGHRGLQNTLKENAKLSNTAGKYPRGKSLNYLFMVKMDKFSEKTLMGMILFLHETNSNILIDLMTRKSTSAFPVSSQF